MTALAVPLSPTVPVLRAWTRRWPAAALAVLAALALPGAVAAHRPALGAVLAVAYTVRMFLRRRQIRSGRLPGPTVAVLGGRTLAAGGAP